MTEQHSPVIAAVSGTPEQDGALRYAVEEATRRQCDLQLVHVSPGYLLREPIVPYLTDEIELTAHAILTEARDRARQLGPGLEVTTKLVHGSRVDAMLDAATAAQLVVVGHESRGAMERLLSGSVTTDLMGHSPVPVVAVPADWQPRPRADRVVVGVKNDAHTDELLAVAFAHAARHDGTVEILHAWRLPSVYADRVEERTHAEQWKRESTALIEKRLGPWRAHYPKVPIKVRVLHEHPGHALVTASVDAGLLVLLRRPPRLHFGPRLGSTARAVVQRAVCPVEVVPSTDAPVDFEGLEVERAGAMLR